MDYRLIYTKPAERDLEEIVRHIAQDNPRAAEKVGLALLKVAESLTSLPHRGTPVRERPDVRKVVRRPYIVFYRVDEARRMIRVQRFWHGKRDPKTLHPE